MITLKIYKDGCTLWYRSIWLHRLNGPAVISKKGKVEYWIKGKPVTEYEIMFFEPIL